MEKKINLEIHIDDKEIIHFNSLKITQAFNRHHEFELIINQDVIEETGSFKIDQSKSWIGKSFIISIDHGNTAFKGVVCEVNLSQSHGLRGNLIIKGYSPTILLESGGNMLSFNEMKLDDIVKKVTSGIAGNDIDLSIKPAYRENLKYITQFKESNFSFINRLSSEYGEFFYYDGRVLHFGKPSQQKSVKLVHGQNLNVMNMAVRILPMGFSYFSYRSEENTTLDTQAPQHVEGLNGFSQHALQQSSSVFDNNVNHPVKPRVENKSQLDKLAEKHKAAMASNLSDITGESTNTALNIGSIADVYVSRKNDTGVFNQDSLSKFLITEITHHIDGLSRYTNTFKGVPADTEVLTVEHVHVPQAESQVAIVTDNNDPSQTGRVKVQMLWQKNNATTDWIRVLTPDGGSSEPFSKNRGYVFIPEVGDQVIVGFRYNDPDRPFVMGSIFHGSTGAGGSDANHMKSIATRSGHLVEFNDGPSGHGITITDINKNIIHIDTAGNNITITANENMTLNAKNMQINVTENLDIQAGNDISTMVGNNMNTQISVNNHVSVGADYSLNAANITEIAADAHKSEATNITKTASSELTYNSTGGSVTKHAAKTINNNSGEKSNLF
jgi:type VI secretion system secreted protein VgrG